MVAALQDFVLFLGQENNLRYFYGRNQVSACMIERVTEDLRDIRRYEITNIEEQCQDVMTRAVR